MFSKNFLITSVTEFCRAGRRRVAGWVADARARNERLGVGAEAAVQ